MATIAPFTHRPPAGQPHLADYDVILINSSGGKDSQSALRVACHAAADAGVLDRVVVLHNDLGERVEWPGVRELAEQQARHYGVRFEVRSKDGVDLLDDVAKRGKWPDAARRWCTSDHKRGPGRKLLTQLVAELGLDRPAKVLQVYGFRAEESPDRARREPLAYNTSASNKTRRHVWDWLPIHDWTVEQVWADIRASGVPYHWAYDKGMSRLSCSFCVLASRADLVRACQLRPDVARQYAEVEARISHSFQNGRRIADLMADAGVS